MQILIADHSGFCEGVQRAFQIALETARAGKPVFMLGDLVHNQQVVSRLESFGVKMVNDLSEVLSGSGGVVLISAHGVSPAVYATAKAKKLEIIDTTCPWVKKPQQLAKQSAEEERLVVVFGDKKHPEVKGVVGWAKGRAVVVENVSDLDRLALAPGERIALLAQTTQVEEDFKKVAERLKTRVKDAAVYDTICGATSKRQAAAVAIARQVDSMLVIGDPKSANTRRLTELCKRTGVPTHQIQSLAELDLNWLAGRKKVGITAGASTPEWIIQVVIEKLKGL